MIKRSIYVGLVVSALVALFAVQRAHAIIIINSMPAQFGPLSLARGQVFRFYLSNPAMGLDAPACDATLMVYDRMGKMVGESKHSARPGQIEFFDVFFDIFTPTSRIQQNHRMNKVSFRAVAQLAGPPDGGMPGPCIMTAEVFDATTGKTEIFINRPDMMMMPASTMGP